LVWMQAEVMPETLPRWHRRRIPLAVD
jgi:hypothetical protein